MKNNNYADISKLLDGVLENDERGFTFSAARSSNWSSTYLEHDVNISKNSTLALVLFAGQVQSEL